MDTQRAIDAAKFFGVPVLPLSQSCQVKGFNGKAGMPITHAIILHLWVDGRRFLNMPFLITDLGQYDIIIGKKWLATQDIWLDMKNQKLIWPKEQTIKEEVQAKHDIPVPVSILQRPKLNPEHQKDVMHRDRLMEAEDKQQKRYKPARTYQRDQQDALQRMNRELSSQREELLLPVTKKQQPTKALCLDIAVIGAAPFHRQSRRKGTEVFVTSLQEIDTEIKSRKEATLQQQWDDDEQEVLQVLPKEYHEFRDVFSKKASDQLPPHREWDHRIELEEGKLATQEVGYSPLRKHTLEELEAIKTYVVENLAKGFIVPGNTPFASPILMARKNDGGLRFCLIIAD